MLNGDGTAKLLRVNRVEIIDSTGRAYVEMNARDVRMALQDGGHTLKVFLANTPPEPVCSGCINQGGFIIADLTCPVHGLNGTDPGDGRRA